MANTKEIQTRMKSIRDTMKITNAMYMISSSKLKKAKRELEATTNHFYGIQNSLNRILRHVPDVDKTGVMPVDRPTVANAEAVSNRMMSRE